ncbi:unnamed protein product [Darwinula stevensoni]|uniref:Uncharacterized protein n=1 Tax=Darwinula stevensoni TaxID=69355 RepID=A0A7R9AFV5_9CRUS|nr:unnamed protein product [Darwinula stevensoni]CAG0903342.1 unnamed protein product [Darwinula stevensoni]
MTRVSGLAGLPNLQVLDLHSNQVSSLAGLENHANLRVVNLAGNRISCIQGLENLPRLVELNLRRNKIKSSETPLPSLPLLQRLYLSHNLIRR